MLFSLLYSLSIGFTDDYIKAVKKQNLGLSPKQKIAAQLVLSALLLGILYLLGDHETTVDLIFVRLNLGIFYYPLMIRRALPGYDHDCGRLHRLPCLESAPGQVLHG